MPPRAMRLLDGKASPLAVALFGFDFVRRVFISGNFVTVTKDDETDWDEVLLEVKLFLKELLWRAEACFLATDCRYQHDQTGYGF